MALGRKRINCNTNKGSACDELEMSVIDLHTVLGSLSHGLVNINEIPLRSETAA